MVSIVRVTAVAAMTIQSIGVFPRVSAMSTASTISALEIVDMMSMVFLSVSWYFEGGAPRELSSKGIQLPRCLAI